MTDSVSIAFPCADYPLKVIAESAADLETQVLGIVAVHVEDFDRDTVSLHPSREGRYTSVRLSITARSEEQLKSLHTDLMAHPLVRLVL